MYAAMTDEQFAMATIDTRTRLPLAEGFIPAMAPPGTAVWRALPIVYDQCISQCICLPWRWPKPGVFFSVHFSCLQGGISKPGHYVSEFDFMHRLSTEVDCNKYWCAQCGAEREERARLSACGPKHAAITLTHLYPTPPHRYLEWYETYKRAAGRLPAPLWEGAALGPTINMTVIMDRPSRIFELPKAPGGRRRR